MSGGGSKQEVEIKLRVPDAATARRLLRGNGFRLRRRRKFESNALFDTPARDLTRAGKLLRVRRSGSRRLLTYKGPGSGGRHKVRREIEVEIADADAMMKLLRGIGMEVIFRYEKYRAEYAAPDGEGVATVDETPIGVFLELEGRPDWIDRAAAAMGFRVSDYITDTYAELYRESRPARRRPQAMLFGERLRGRLGDSP